MTSFASAKSHRVHGKLALGALAWLAIGPALSVRCEEGQSPVYLGTSTPAGWHAGELNPTVEPNTMSGAPLRLWEVDRQHSNLAPRTLDSLHGPLLRRDLGINSAQSCATSNCHGGPRPGVAQPSARRGAEFHLWIENDPHARSWRTLCSDESLEMMRRLKIVQGTEIVDADGFDNCLACHNTSRHAHAAGAATGLREGVGCDACHGPSERWIQQHVQQDWSAVSAQADGFVLASDLYVRARMCAACHVGDSDRDMNHDLIAAGHPALRYEFATFHAWQPKHWRDAESEHRKSYEAQLWLAGQVAATDAALALLESRASHGNRSAPWPEFAAYDCASCHHRLGFDNQRTPLDSERQATAIYSAWNEAGIRWLIDHRHRSGQATIHDEDLLAALDSVKRAMERAAQPNASEVGQAAATAREALASWFRGAGPQEREQFGSDRLARMVATAASNPETFRTWESAVQFYLAAVAARESWPGGWQGPLLTLSQPLQMGLGYPERRNVSRYALRGGGRPALNPFGSDTVGSRTCWLAWPGHATPSSS